MDQRLRAQRRCFLHGKLHLPLLAAQRKLRVQGWKPQSSAKFRFLLKINYDQKRVRNRERAQDRLFARERLRISLQRLLRAAINRRVVSRVGVEMQFSIANYRRGCQRN